MIFIEPHIHMYSRTTDDYTAMYREGVRVAIEPSFWLGANRRYAGRSGITSSSSWILKPYARSGTASTTTRAFP